MLSTYDNAGNQLGGRGYVERGERITGTWRIVATVISLTWIVTAVLLIFISVSGAAHRLTTLALMLGMLAGLPILTLLKNISSHLTARTSPGRQDQILAGFGALLIAAAWATHLLS